MEEQNRLGFTAVLSVTHMDLIGTRGTPKYSVEIDAEIFSIKDERLVHLSISLSTGVCNSSIFLCFKMNKAQEEKLVYPPISSQFPSHTGSQKMKCEQTQKCVLVYKTALHFVLI